MSRDGVRPPGSSSRPDWVLVALLASSVALNLWQFANRRVSAPEGARPVEIPIGTVLGAMKVREVPSGKSILLEHSEGTGTLVYVFAPGCKWCERNWQNFRAVEDAARARGLRVLGVCLESDIDTVRQYAEARGLKFEIVADPSDETIAKYGLGSTPSTLVLAPGGSVLATWKGAYSGRIQTEIEQWAGVRLPGLAPATKQG